MNDLHNIDDPIALAEAILALPCTNEGEAATLGAHAHRLAEMLADAADEAKAADTHRNLNRRVAEVLGLTGWRTDPETGDDYLPSWHDMPERVEALVKEQERLRGELAWHEEMNGTRAEQDADDAEADALDAAADALTPEQIRAELIEVGLDPDQVAREAEVAARLVVRSMQAREERDEARIEADAFATYRAMTTGALGIDAASCADDVREAIEALNVARDNAHDPRPSNHLLTLTPYLLSRVEALGYTPGETPSGVLPWLVEELEHQRGYSAMLAAIARPGPLITGFAPDAVNVRDRLLGWLITAYAMELKERTPEQAPNNLALAISFPADHPLHGYRVEMAVARPEKPTPREQLDEARKTLDEIRTALGNGADEALWPPGKTLGEVVKRLATMPFEVRALAKHYDRDGDFWSCLRCGGMWPRDIVTACATCHQSGSAEGDEDDIEEEPVEGEDAP